MLAKLSNYSFLITVSLLTLFGSFAIKAQSTSGRCEKGYVYDQVYDQVYEPETETWYNTANMAWEVRTVSRYKWRYVWKCVPVASEANSTTSTNKDTSHPNTVRNADGTLRPARGYRWVDSKAPNDFRVELKPNLINPFGYVKPASGYQWVNPKDPDDVRVELMPGLIKTEKGTFNPAKGYRWVNPKDPKDLEVEKIP